MSLYVQCLLYRLFFDFFTITAIQVVCSKLAYVNSVFTHFVVLYCSYLCIIFKFSKDNLKQSLYIYIYIYVIAIYVITMHNYLLITIYIIAIYIATYIVIESKLLQMLGCSAVCIIILIHISLLKCIHCIVVLHKKQSFNKNKLASYVFT